MLHHAIRYIVLKLMLHTCCILMLPLYSQSDPCTTMSAQPNVLFTNSTMLLQYSNVTMVECLEYCCQDPECHSVTYSGFLHSSSGLTCLLYPCTSQDTSCSLKETLNQIDKAFGVLTAFLQRNDQDIDTVLNSDILQKITTTFPRNILNKVDEVTPSPHRNSAKPISVNFWNIPHDSSSTANPLIIISGKSKTSSENVVTSTSKVNRAKDVAIPITLVIIVSVLLIICIIVNSVLAAAVMVRRRNRRISRGGGFEINPVYAHSPAPTVSSGTLSAVAKPYTNTVTDSIPNYFATGHVKAYDNFYC